MLLLERPATLPCRGVPGDTDTAVKASGRQVRLPPPPPASRLPPASLLAEPAERAHTGLASFSKEQNMEGHVCSGDRGSLITIPLQLQSGRMIYANYYAGYHIRARTHTQNERV